MNNSTAVFLVSEHIRCLRINYGDEVNTQRTKSGTYSNLVKTFDPDIQKGDYVVVTTNSRHGMTVVRVEDVDVPFDIRTEEEIRWVVDVVDVTDHKKRLEEEAVLIEAVNKARFKKEQENLRDELAGAYAKELKALPMARK
jgi:hypothetical protein